MTSLRETFARELQKRRRDADITQAELAEAVDKSVDMISRLERATIGPSFDTLEALAYALGVHPSVLLGGRPANPTPVDKKAARVIKMVLDADAKRLAQIERVIMALDE